MSQFDEENGLDGSPCAKCGYPDCVGAKGCLKRQREQRHKQEVATLRAESERLAARVAEAEAKHEKYVCDHRDVLLSMKSERDTALAERDSLKAQLAGAQKKLEELEAHCRRVMERVGLPAEAFQSLREAEAMLDRRDSDLEAAEEQLRVAREALDGVKKVLSRVSLSEETEAEFAAALSSLKEKP